MLKSCTFILLVFLACSPSKEKEAVVSSNQTVNNHSPELSLDTLELQKYLMGHFDPKQDDRFVVIDSQYADQKGRLLRKEAYLAFINMHQAASEEGIDLVIKSATRNFDYQKGIWERKWTGESKLSSGVDASAKFGLAKERAQQILKYSSMPGTSRHHWGTDIDLNSFNNTWFESGQGLLVFNWLEENAHKFGFCRPYTEKDSLRPNGYNEEKWHWSYLPLADSLTKQSRKLLNSKMIKGFLGSETANELNVINHYVLGINQGCVH